MRIAIVNDNNTNLMILKYIIEKQTDYEIAWMTHSGADAIQKCKEDTPDLILMDMIMPKMDGVDTTRIIMVETPCAILIVTASISGNTAMIFKAMSYGALDVVQTPFSNVTDIDVENENFLRKLKIVNNLISTDNKKNISLSQQDSTPEKLSCKKIVVIGASTGGPGVLATILKLLPADFPAPIIIVQHVDSSFAHNFALWLNDQSNLSVRTAEEGEHPKIGTVLVAGKNEHLIMTKNEKLTYSELQKDLIYKPSVDVLFNSVAKYWQGDVIAALLTGMGKDGAQGLDSINKRGGHTITQTKETCAVYGMPKAADELGVSSQSLAPEEIAQSIINVTYNTKKHELA